MTSSSNLNFELLRLVSERQDETAFQRLEFLGDRVLGAVTADMIFYRYPGVPVSVLAQKIAQMLSNQVLAGVALAHLGIASADTLEAYVGALYVEGGLEACRDWLAPILDDLDATPLERPWRTLLNTYAQQNKIELDFHSRELNRKWICSLYFAGLRFDAYDHVRKQDAERDVARQACRHLQL